MKYILIVTFLLTPLFALFEDENSFSADFIQKITDESGKQIEYRGQITAIKPNTVFWHYSYPIEKRVYLYKNRVTIVEPELEQVIIKPLEKNYDLFSLMKNAQKVSSKKYEVDFNEQKYTIELNGKLLYKILYSDSFDNNISIEFKNQKRNQFLNIRDYQPNIPKDFDVLY